MTLETEIRVIVDRRAGHARIDEEDQRSTPEDAIVAAGLTPTGVEGDLSQSAKDADLWEGIAVIPMSLVTMWSEKTTVYVRRVTRYGVVCFFLKGSMAK